MVSRERSKALRRLANHKMTEASFLRLKEGMPLDPDAFVVLCLLLHGLGILNFGLCACFLRGSEKSAFEFESSWIFVEHAISRNTVVALTNTIDMHVPFITTST